MAIDIHEALPSLSPPPPHFRRRCLLRGFQSFFHLSFPIEMQCSDLAEVECASILERFRQSTSEWSQNINIPEDCGEPGNADHKPSMIVVTDACLPSIILGEGPISARVLNYELPTKKETYLRRMSTCLAPDGIVINMVVGGEVVTLKGIEESSGLVIAHQCEILKH